MGRWFLSVMVCVLNAVVWVPAARATTVLRAPLSELASNSDVIVHGLVRHVDDELAEGPDGPFLTAVDIEVLEVLKGLAPGTATFRITLPGGRALGRVMKIPGMPMFETGQEVLLLLERHRRGFSLTGLAQGVFTIRRTGQVAIAQRDLRGLELVGPVADSMRLSELPPGLEQLLVDLRRWGATAPVEGRGP